MYNEIRLDGLIKQRKERASLEKREFFTHTRDAQNKK